MFALCAWSASSCRIGSASLGDLAGASARRELERDDVRDLALGHDDLDLDRTEPGRR